MLVSNDFKEFILRKSFKRFFFNSVINRIELEQKITSDDMNSIINLYSSYGFKSKKNVEEYVTTFVNTNGDLLCLENEVKSLNIVELESGYSLILAFQYGIEIKLMYLGRFKFIIEKDTSQVLLPCDIIESLTFGFTVGKNALFRIWRNNILYPDEKKVYNLKPIESIRITRNNIFDVEKKKDDNLPVKKSIEKLYAWHTEGMYPAFSEESITKNSDALYEIDIEKMTYSINPKFKTKIYKNRDIDIFNELKESCDIIQGKQKISCSINLISNGTLCIENCISGNFILQINQKAKISL